MMTWNKSSASCRRLRPSKPVLGFYVFPGKDSTNLRQMFILGLGENTCVYYNLLWKTVHRAFKNKFSKNTSSADLCLALEGQLAKFTRFWLFFIFGVV